MKIKIVYEVGDRVKVTKLDDPKEASLYVGQEGTITKVSSYIQVKLDNKEYIWLTEDEMAPVVVLPLNEVIAELVTKYV